MICLQPGIPHGGRSPTSSDVRVDLVQSRRRLRTVIVARYFALETAPYEKQLKVFSLRRMGGQYARI
jgi:hypothetical protein